MYIIRYCSSATPTSSAVAAANRTRMARDPQETIQLARGIDGDLVQL